MSNLANEVELISINVKHIRTDMPYVEYNEYNNGDIVAVDRLNINTATINCETHRAKIVTFRKIIPSYRHNPDGRFSENIEDTHIALDKDAQKLVDMFIKIKHDELMTIMEKLNITNEVLVNKLRESNMSIYERFIRWIKKI